MMYKKIIIKQVNADFIGVGCYLNVSVMPDQSILVLYPGFQGHQQCCQFVCTFILLSVPFVLRSPMSGIAIIL